MSNFDPLEYKGNVIFRNQPNHIYFDKPFEDGNDRLFQILNEIHPHFLQPERQAESINFSNSSVIDPRTQKPITKLCYDYTKEEETTLFCSPKKSAIHEKQHELGVRVLNALQQCMEVEEEDMYNWYRIQKTRLKETQSFQKFVFEFNQSIKEQMYGSCRKLLELYQNWYEKKSKKLMQRYPQESYNTHLGLPKVMLCKNVLSDLEVMIINPQIVNTIGETCYFNGDIKEELKKFNHTLGSLAEAYGIAEDRNDSLEDNLQLEFEEVAKQEICENPYIYMPLESVLFLLTTGDYVDIPTEMLVNIKEIENMEGNDKKIIIMDVPLPSRQCGWHTYEQIVDQAALAMLSMKQVKPPEVISKSNAALSKSTDFTVTTLRAYMEKSVYSPDKLCKFSKTLTKWQLGTLENDERLQLYTSLNDLTENKRIFLKLEYKPTFGCEILTKYEILKQWFTIKLTGASKSSCLRLNVANYHTLLEEPIDASKLEESLSSLYRINCNHLLNGLFEFLKMLYNMPSGRYMLRYNPKFKDKLMFCKPSQELTQNTIHLHNLLNTDVTDIEFMSQNNFLAIDANLCSLMHLQHKILPAAFSPRVSGKKVFYNNKALLTTAKNVKLARKVSKNTITNKTRMKRIRRKKRAYNATKAKNDDLKELEEEMELDRKMLQT